MDYIEGSLPPAAGDGIREQPEGRGERSGAERDPGPEASDCQAPDLCNTGALSSNQGKEVSEKRREAGGFDTLHLGLYGEWNPDAFGEVTAEWDACKQAAEEGDREGSIWHSEGGAVWVFKGHGSKHGGGCRWWAEWDGCTLFIANQAEAVSGRNNLFVQMHSLALMARGQDAIYAELVEMLAAIGFRVQGHILGRLDPCVDLAGVGVKSFTQPALSGHEITRAKQGGLRFGAIASDHQTYERGNRKGVFMRIYDKLLETEHGENAEAKRAILKEKRWGGEVEEATRVEFQVDRETLKDRFQIDTLDDLRVKGPQLLAWLTEEWYRLAESPVDRKNKNQWHADIHPLWRQVQEAFASWIGQNTIPTILPRKVLNPKVDQMLKQMRGLFASVCALSERTFGDAVELGTVGMEWMAVESEWMFDALGIKRQELAARLEPAIAGAGDTPF